MHMILWLRRTTQNNSDTFMHKVCDLMVTWIQKGQLYTSPNINIYCPTYCMYTRVSLPQILIVSLRTYLWGLLVDILLYFLQLFVVLGIAFFTQKEKRWNCPDVLPYYRCLFKSVLVPGCCDIFLSQPFVLAWGSCDIFKLSGLFRLGDS